MKKEFCCESMKYHIEFKCDIHKDPFDCPDKIINYSKKQNVYGIIIHDRGNSFIEINFCPWCGTKINIEK
ncbi:MAG: hypothetical protein KA133_02870 [Flavobacterium sp.]|nr:hypothetical protein [Flavobacterium sp.]